MMTVPMESVNSNNISEVTGLPCDCYGCGTQRKRCIHRFSKESGNIIVFLFVIIAIIGMFGCLSHYDSKYPTEQRPLTFNQQEIVEIILTGEKAMIMNVPEFDRSKCPDCDYYVRLSNGEKVYLTEFEMRKITQ